MRALATVIAAFLALALPATAETGPPTKAEISEAKAACAAEVQQDCLFTLAVDVVLASTDPDQVQARLNHIATIQAIEGDGAGADRTLSLTTPDAMPLLALGRVEDAGAALKREFADLEARYGTKVEGPLATFLLLRMATVGRSDLALSTPLYVANNGEIQQIDPLPSVFSGYLDAGNLNEAASVFNRMDKGDSNLGDRLLRLVKALADAGDLAQAAGIVSGFPDPQAQAQARVVLAQAYLASGRAAEAKAELDRILASVTGDGAFPHWTLSVLAPSADVALQAGEIPIARKHAQAAFEAYQQQTKGRLSQNLGQDYLSDLLRLAAVLEGVGATGKASAILARASQPVPLDASDKPLIWHFDALYVTQVRMGGKDAASATLQKLREAGPSTLLALTPAALELAGLGFQSEARQIARLVVAQASSGERGAINRLADAYAVYAAILAKDPELAPDLLQEDLGAWLQFKLTLDRARALHAAGQVTEAEAVLVELAANLKGQFRPGSDAITLTVCALPAIAREMAKLGLDQSAATVRQGSLAMALGTGDGIQRSHNLVALAASFADARPATVNLALPCLEYPT